MKFETLKKLFNTLKNNRIEDIDIHIELNPLAIVMSGVSDFSGDSVCCKITDGLYRELTPNEMLVDLHIEAERLNIQKEERARLIRKIQAYLLYTNRGKVDDKLNEFLEDQLR